MLTIDFININIIRNLTISNKSEIKPAYGLEPEYDKLTGWWRGYPFNLFLGNVLVLLGELQRLDGIQQLCHRYYRQNGNIGAKETAERIKKFLGV